MEERWLQDKAAPRPSLSKASARAVLERTSRQSNVGSGRSKSATARVSHSARSGRTSTSQSDALASAIKNNPESSSCAALFCGSQVYSTYHYAICTSRIFVVLICACTWKKAGRRATGSYRDGWAGGTEGLFVPSTLGMPLEISLTPGQNIGVALREHEGGIDDGSLHWRVRQGRLIMDRRSMCYKKRLDAGYAQRNDNSQFSRFQKSLDLVLPNTAQYQNPW